MKRSIEKIKELLKLNSPSPHTEEDRTEWRLPDGTIHRVGFPAIEFFDGQRVWYNHGQIHREDGPAIIHPDGSCEWWKQGRPHRVDGPAIEYSNGYREWFNFGKRHRTDGPAVEYPDGEIEFWLSDKNITEKAFYKKKIKKG